MKKFNCLFIYILLSNFLDFCLGTGVFREQRSSKNDRHSPEHFSNSSTSSHMKVQCSQCSNQNTYTCGFLWLSCCDCSAGNFNSLFYCNLQLFGYIFLKLVYMFSGQYSQCGWSTCSNTPAGTIIIYLSIFLYQ